MNRPLKVESKIASAALKSVLVLLLIGAAVPIIHGYLLISRYASQKTIQVDLTENITLGELGVMRPTNPFGIGSGSDFLILSDMGVSRLIKISTIVPHTATVLEDWSTEKRAISVAEIAVDKDDTIYALDRVNSVIRIFPSVEREKRTLKLDFPNPSGLALDSDKNIYIFNRNTEIIVRLLPTGEVDNTWTGGKVPGMQINSLEAIQDRVFATSSGNYRFLSYDKEGTLLVNVELPFRPINIRSAGNMLYAIEDGVDRIWALNTVGEVVGRLDGPAFDQSKIGQPKQGVFTRNSFYVLQPDKISNLTLVDESKG